MENEIVSTRVLPFPRALVWRAYTEPEHLAVWWGPNGFTNTFETFELKPGGEWKFVMHGPNGADYRNHSVFRSIDEPERIAFRHLGDIHAFDVTISLEEVSGGTRAEFRMRFDTAEERDRVKGFVVPANEENFDRLEAELGRMHG